ncbi:MAG: hypothetical protein WD294_15205 [Phycisphaeraceae bacterium]
MPRRQFSTPLLINDGEANELQRLSLEDRAFDESKLQDMLFKHPCLLPAGELEPIFADLIPLAREVPTRAGPIDLLYQTADGHLALVETKLWRNPTARRTVVAQIIDYAKEMARWSYDDFVQAVRRAEHSNGDWSDVQDPVLELAREADDEFDEAEFHDQLSRNLRHGRFLLLIVGDGIREDVEQLAAYLQQTPQLGFTLGLIEIALYPLSADKQDPMLVQPRIIARTQQITRAVVEVRTGVAPSDVRVTLPADTSSPASTAREPITEQQFFEELEEKAGSEVKEFAKWTLDETERLGWWVDWKATGGPVVKYQDPDTGMNLTLFQLYRDGRLTEMGRYRQRCRQMDLPDDLWQRYMDDVARLVPGAQRREFRSKVGGIYYDVATGPKPFNDAIRLSELIPKKREWLDIVARSATRFSEAVDREQNDT